MVTDVKKHTTLAAGETPSRAGLAAAILSIDDVIPVANATEAAQVVQAVAATGQSIASQPVTISRADARGLHRLEICFDPTGAVLLPASGVLAFSTKTAADSWAASNGSYLTARDRCRAGGIEYRWSGTAWQPMITAEATGTVACPNTAGGGTAPVYWSDLITVTFPAGLFTAAPTVFVQTIGPAAQVPIGGLVEQITTSGCQVRGMRIGSVPSTSFSVQWLAVQQ